MAAGWALPTKPGWCVCLSEYYIAIAIAIAPRAPIGLLVDPGYPTGCGGERAYILLVVVACFWAHVATQLEHLALLLSA